MTNRVIMTSTNGFLVTATHSGPIDERIDSLEVVGELTVSDGHHTIDELYLHRHTLFIALCKQIDRDTLLKEKMRVWKARIHYDGTAYPGWFLLCIEIKEFDTTVRQISYHLPNIYWNKCPFLGFETAPIPYDGHTPDDVIKSLLEL